MTGSTRRAVPAARGCGTSTQRARVGTPRRSSTDLREIDGSGPDRPPNDVEPTDLRSMTAIRRAEVVARGAAWPRAGTPQIVAPFAPHGDRGAADVSGAAASARSVGGPAAQSPAGAQPQLLPWRAGVLGPVTPPAPCEGDDQEPDDAAQDREGDPRDHDDPEDGVSTQQDRPPSPPGARLALPGVSQGGARLERKRHGNVSARSAGVPQSPPPCGPGACDAGCSGQDRLRRDAALGHWRGDLRAVARGDLRDRPQ